jgi:hypothetical protein
MKEEEEEEREGEEEKKKNTQRSRRKLRECLSDTQMGTVLQAKSKGRQNEVRSHKNLKCVCQKSPKMKSEGKC